MFNNCCLYYSHISCISSIVQHCTFGIIIALYKFVYKQTIEAFHLKKNHLDAQFIFSIFRQKPLHVLGISIAHHQEVHRVTTTIGTCCSNPARTTNCHLKRTISTNCCSHTVYPLMMGYRYARNI
jgi:hypothetical protein